MPDSFNPERVDAGLAGTCFAGLIRHAPVVTSTSTLAMEAAEAGARAGVWVADAQTAGRGRGGHTWHSAGAEEHVLGLYVSALVTPEVALADAPRIPLATGMAAQAGVEEVAGLRPDIRWPNDLLFGERKCGGILVESSAAAGAEERLRFAVIGIGINLNQTEFPADLTGLATSLRTEGGAVVDRDALLTALLRHLDAELARLTAPDLFERFAAASSWVRGKRVRVGESGGYTGVTSGLDGRGFLQIQADDGSLRTVLSGGVRTETPGL